MPLTTPPERLAPVLSWIDKHSDQAIQLLQRFCRQPSISAQRIGMDDMAALVQKHLRTLGANVQLVQTNGFPVVVGQFSGQSPRRLALYNHYDVQPPEPLEAWITPPFAADIRNGRLYARGVADNKGNLVARLCAVQAWRDVYGSVPGHLTFFVEGEEEIGSPDLACFAENHRDLLQADGCLWETGYRDHNGNITLTAGLKGLLSVELYVKTVAHDLHSSYAPLAPNAAWRLLEALHTLRDASGRILIPGFYDTVRPPTELERQMMARFPLDGEMFRQLWHIDTLEGPTDPVALTEHFLYTPTCNICGIWSGYTGEGSKTVLPSVARAKIDFRLVPDQDPKQILHLLCAHLQQQGFGDIKVVSLASPSLPAQSSLDDPLVETLAHAAEYVYGMEPQRLPRRAGSGPMEAFCQQYGLPVVNGAGVGYEGSHVHSPNENIRLDDFLLNIKLIAVFLAEFAASSSI